ncbi:hypothetical protein QR680_001601 [Steinernema hermaphroditum]|uniref:alanine--glyoxylate transaminase n=1 Tax=Steinernema hermaphroditum TaxID=289476 RepID=A0AA39LFV4_9BILA|nr:hypothetical protein QR680_001601 [Steinernema hermaphroditum]
MGFSVGGRCLMSTRRSVRASDGLRQGGGGGKLFDSPPTAGRAAQQINKFNSDPNFKTICGVIKRLCEVVLTFITSAFRIVMARKQLHINQPLVLLQRVPLTLKKMAGEFALYFGDRTAVRSIRLSQVVRTAQTSSRCSTLSKLVVRERHFQNSRRDENNAISKIYTIINCALVVISKHQCWQRLKRHLETVLLLEHAYSKCVHLHLSPDKKTLLYQSTPRLLRMMLKFSAIHTAARGTVQLSMRALSATSATPNRPSSLQPLLPEKNYRRAISQKAQVVHPNEYVVEPPAALLREALVPKVKLYGPGPSDMPDSIQQSLNAPLLGHLHPQFLNIMKDVRSGLQYVFQTQNKLTFALSGTGHAGMECAFVNLCERNERVLIIKNGIWGARAADLAKRLELDVKVLEVTEGEVVHLDRFAKTVKEFLPSAVFLCHGESSTGVAHPLSGFGEVCRDSGALLIVDTVASLGGAPFNCDDLLVDCVYSATQKCLNAPPGLAPMSFNERAIEKIKSRKNRVPSFYFDVLEVGNYWGCFEDAPRYHHTAPISTVYSLRAALSLVVQEGIENSVERHLENSKFLYQLLESNGLELFVENPDVRLPCLTTVKVPEGVEWKKVNDALMQKGLEISGGLGPTLGKIWRIGTFGDNSRREKIEEVCRMFVNEVNAHRK